jgi:hypothetical protein
MYLYYHGNGEGTSNGIPTGIRNEDQQKAYQEKMIAERKADQERREAERKAYEKMMDDRKK